MGQFSWFTSDTKQQITEGISRNIFMTGKDGRVFHLKTPYEGYGEFGGKDFYEYLAELNDLPSDRQEGINLTFNIGGGRGDLKILERHGYSSPRLFAEERSVRNWDKFDPPEPDPDQGWLQDEEEDDDYYEDDYYESAIKIKKDIKIGDIILEKGDRIRVLKELEKVYFKNEFPMSVDNAKKISIRYQSPWYDDSDEWTLYVSGKHTMTYSPREGKLFTDLDINQVNNIIK